MCKLKLHNLKYHVHQSYLLKNIYKLPTEQIVAAFNLKYLFGTWRLKIACEAETLLINPLAALRHMKGEEKQLHLD